MELQTIQNRIHELRGQRVMLDYDLAELYEVETRVLKQAVKRNVDRFPHDFMFQLTNDEIDHMVSQNVIPSKSHLGGASPFAFSEQGVAMLSTVLKSKKAVMVNISIMRAFVTLRQHLFNYKDLKEQVAKLEEDNNKKFKDVYEAINYLLDKDHQETEKQARRKIGFRRNEC
jgi:regulator of PEP synthase PpsR (kinase-PPPase family)